MPLYNSLNLKGKLPRGCYNSVEIPTIASDNFVPKLSRIVRMLLNGELRAAQAGPGCHIGAAVPFEEIFILHTTRRWVVR